VGKNNFSSSPLVVGVAVKNSIAVVVTKWRRKLAYIKTTSDLIEFVRRQFAAFAVISGVYRSSLHCLLRVTAIAWPIGN